MQKTLSGAGFLLRIVELNLNDPRSPERIVYLLYVIATIFLLVRLAGYEDSRKQVLFWSKKRKELQDFMYGLGDKIASEQTIRCGVSIVDSNELCKVMTDYFVIRKENSEKHIDSISPQDREVIATDGQNIMATRLKKNGSDERKRGGSDIVIQLMV